MNPGETMTLITRITGAALLAVASTTVLAEEHEGGHHAEAWQVYGPHHLSVIVGGTHMSGEGTAETIGIDYEYRISDYLGLGAVFEHAAGDINANTTLAVADLHPFHNPFIIQLGLGVEARNGEEEGDVFVGRAGMLYEFEYGRFTVSPQLHWDYHHDHHNAIVAGFAFGVAF